MYTEELVGMFDAGFLVVGGTDDFFFEIGEEILEPFERIDVRYDPEISLI